MTPRIKISMLPILLASLLPSLRVEANGVTDLQKQLLALSGDTPIEVTLESSHSQNRDRDDKHKTTTGYIALKAAADKTGLHLIYDQDILNRIEKEQLLLEQDEHADTPTRNALNRLDTSDVNEMLSTAPSLLRFVNKAKFIDESVAGLNGKKVRRLVFDLPLESVVESSEVRDYVDEFEGKYTIFIDDEGVPLESILSFNGSGSAFVIFSVEMAFTRTARFAKHGARLVKVQEETQQTSTSTFADTESTEIRQLTILSPQLVNRM